MANFSQTTNHCHPGKPTTLFGPRTADWNPTNATRATSYLLLSTKTPNAVHTDDIITMDINRHDTVDFGHETSLQVPRPPPQPPPLPWPALLSQHRASQLGYQTGDGFTGDAAHSNTINCGYETPTYILPPEPPPPPWPPPPQPRTSTCYTSREVFAPTTTQLRKTADEEWAMLLGNDTHTPLPPPEPPPAPSHPRDGNTKQRRGFNCGTAFVKKCPESLTHVLLPPEPPRPPWPPPPQPRTLTSYTSREVFAPTTTQLRKTADEEWAVLLGNDTHTPLPPPEPPPAPSHPRDGNTKQRRGFSCGTTVVEKCPESLTHLTQPDLERSGCVR